tara:strand:- start:865 stop:1512 length:648 start_codon:yes stop_codon:yes gene_type:complete
MITVHKDVINDKQLNKLLEYHYLDDERTDTRTTVRSKHPRWDIDKWPQEVIEPLIDNDSIVEEVIFNESTISFQIHVDSGYNNPYVNKGIIVPLKCEHGSTVFFNNYWDYDAAKFVRSEDPYSHVKDNTKQITTKDQRITNYSNIVGYTNRPFDTVLYSLYLTHIPYDNLHGLMVDKVVPWTPGDIIVFDRKQLHCASNEHDHKIGMTVFTNLKH